MYMFVRHAQNRMKFSLDITNLCYLSMHATAMVEVIHEDNGPMALGIDVPNQLPNYNVNYLYIALIILA